MLRYSDWLPMSPCDAVKFQNENRGSEHSTTDPQPNGLTGSLSKSENHGKCSISLNLIKQHFPNHTQVDRDSKGKSLFYSAHLPALTQIQSLSPRPLEPLLWPLLCQHHVFLLVAAVKLPSWALFKNLLWEGPLALLWHLPQSHTSPKFS